jgi:hypothetical protein
MAMSAGSMRELGAPAMELEAPAMELEAPAMELEAPAMELAQVRYQPAASSALRDVSAIHREFALRD